MRTNVLHFNTENAAKKDLTRGLAIFDLKDPIKIPADAKRHPKISLYQFSFTNFFKNIKASLNNNKIYYSNDSKDDEQHTITIPDGSYTISSLNNYCVWYQKEVYTDVIFQLLPNTSNNSTLIQFVSGVTNYYVWFKTDASPYVLLGWNADQYVPASKANVDNDVEAAPNTSVFNNVKAIKIRCNLTSEAYDEGERSNVLFKVIPTVHVGSIQLTRPNPPLWITSNTLVGTTSRVTFNLTDQNNVELDTSGEQYDVSVRIATE